MNSIDIVSKAAQRENLTHAYLAPVRAGTDLGSYAAELGQIILCSSGNQGCREKVVRDTHPDFIRVNILNDNSQISINQVEEIISSSSYSPVEAQKKLYVINRAEDLSQEGANSLLKILEDPPEFVYFLLLTESPNSLLPTIISRCQQLPLGGTSVDGMKDLLSNRGYNNKEVEYLIEVVNRKVNLLNELVEDEIENPLQKRQEFADKLDGADISELSSSLQDRKNYLEKDVIARQLFKRLEEATNFQLINSAAELTKLSREELKWFLEKGLNLHLDDCRTELAGGTYPETNLAKVKILNRALTSLQGNVNIQLLLESLFLNLANKERNFNRPDGV